MFGVCIIITLVLLPAKTRQQTGSTPREEVDALHDVARQMGKTDWPKLNSDPCSSDSGWSQPYVIELQYNNSVECDCSYPDGACHIVHLFIKGQNLSGNLPKSIAKLPYLKILDLGKNCLTGNIPREWASSPKLEYLSLYVNNLTGQLPGYLGKISTLTSLNVECNQFTGTVPPELGKLSNLKTLILTANNFTGKLPSSLSQLTRLKQLRINSNNFSGIIPDFIGSWKSLEILWMLASGLDGPIPQSISALTNLTNLRISDLKTGGSIFPPLENMPNMKYLILRNCNISGLIPDYIAHQMKALKLLDLSFNKLNGNLPKNYQNMSSLEHMYLTSNFLTGILPNSFDLRCNNAEKPEACLINGGKSTIDVSYNNFSAVLLSCEKNIDLFKSTRSNKNSEPYECSGEYSRCSKGRMVEPWNLFVVLFFIWSYQFVQARKKQHSVHINCGGPKTTVKGIVYEEDVDRGGPAKFQPSKEEWFVSTSGHFTDAKSFQQYYIAKNLSVLTMPYSKLYQNARLTPLSLTYYVRCLANGNYTVKLHFAEIVIRDDRSFYSIVRRVFDVYIQDQLELKDFDIINAAGGADTVYIHNSTAVVTSGSLEIRFYWAGRGTTTGPLRYVYGPLISAIDVELESDFPAHNWKIIIAGIVVSMVLLIFIIIATLWWKGFFGGRTSREQELVGLNPQTIFSFKQIKAATNDFDQANKIGEGGFGPVHKGALSDGTLVAVKQLSSKSRQGNREFLNEVGMISALQHPNLVRLYGCCVEGNQLLLIYEYLENNSLARALFDRGEEQSLKLDWCTRQKICVGMAKGLAFLHEESALKIVHRDIKCTNVLLDGDLNPKISDFGLAKLDEEENTHISTRIAGTIGYMAPEYALWGHLTDKADVYSFGVVALEIVAGQSNMKNQQGQSSYVCLVDYALVLQQKGNLLELVDPRLGSEFNEKEVTRVVKIALLCTNPSPVNRPSMSKVVSMLEGQTDVSEVMKDPTKDCDELRFKAMRNQFEQLSRNSPNESQVSRRSASESRPLVRNSTDSTWIGSSSSTSGYDLYPVSR